MSESLPQNFEGGERLVQEGLRKVAGLDRPDHGLELQVCAGWDQEVMEQIIQKSRQPHILQSTPRDAQDRFKDEASFKKWLAGERKLYPLLDSSSGDLAGIIWYGKSALPEDIDIGDTPPPENTFAIRLYEGYGGKQIAPEFMAATLLDFMEDSNAENGVWLQTDVSNERAYNLYKNFGYQEIARDEKRITMVIK